MGNMNTVSQISITGCRHSVSNKIQRRQKYNLSKFDGRGPAIKLGSNTIEPGGHVRVLGVIMSSDLSLEKHVSAVSATRFLCQTDSSCPAVVGCRVG